MKQDDSKTFMFGAFIAIAIIIVLGAKQTLQDNSFLSVATDVPFLVFGGLFFYGIGAILAIAYEHLTENLNKKVKIILTIGFLIIADLLVAYWITK